MIHSARTRGLGVWYNPASWSKPDWLPTDRQIVDAPDSFTRGLINFFGGTFQPPATPPAPAAPQTREEMIRWAPTDLARRNAENFELWRTSNIFPDPPGGTSNAYLWAIAAGGAALLYFTYRGISR